MNSAWGIVSNILQTLFVSAFFVIIARKFSTDDFAHFLIANTVYQLIVAFSSMGLGQWFIREFDLQTDRATFTGKFIKLQVYLGASFYFVNILLAFILYDSTQIHLLAIILGVNVIFDNLIYSVKNLNIAESRQRTTFSILIIDGFLKLLIGCLMFVFPLTVYVLSLLLLAVRFLTLNLFIKLGSSNSLTVRNLWNASVSYEDVKKQILLNWRFVVIGSISIIYWRAANIIISKVLSTQNVADYEISFRIFSIGLILPTIASATVFARFIKFFNTNNTRQLKDTYNKVFIVYNVFSFLFYAFIYTFAHIIMPLAFGGKFTSAVPCLQQMFLTFLLFPTVLLQANLIVAMQAEKIDMWLNILSLVINVALCLTGLYYNKSLSVVNYSIFISFAVFHILQNVFLIKKGITTIMKCICFYLILTIYIVFYKLMSERCNPYAIFVITCMVTCFLSALVLYKSFNKQEFSIKKL